MAAEPVHLYFAREVRRHGTIAARGFHDEYVGLHVIEARAAQDGLVAKTNVTGVEQRFFLPAHHDAGGAERVAGVVKFQRWRSKTGAIFLIGRPFDFAVVTEPLEQRGDLVHFIVRIERVFPDAEFVTLAGHHVDRVVEHPFDKKIAQLGHQHVCFGEMAQRHGERTDVVMMTMSDSDGVQLFFCDELVKWQAVTAFVFGMRAGVHEQPVAFDFHKPGAGADVVSGVEVNDAHKSFGVRS